MQQEGYSGLLRRPVLLAFILLFLTVLPTVAQTNSLTLSESFGDSSNLCWSGGLSFAKILSGPGIVVCPLVTTHCPTCLI